MRASLFYDPRVAIERIAVAFARARRRRILRHTPAAALQLGHLDSLELLQLLADLPPAVIYDIGANVGTWSCLAKSLFPKARIEAFEPLVQHEPDFRRWTAAWPNDIRLHALALGRTNCTAQINVTNFSDASSLLPVSDVARQELKIEIERRETISVATIDGLVAAGDLDSPDLLKLDVQGFELEVLRGAEHTLQRTRAIFCEVSFRPFYEGQPLFADILFYLRERGFVLHALGAHTGPGVPLDQTDALFLRKP